MFRTKTPDTQQSMWLPTADIVATPAGGFYSKLNEALAAVGFGDQVRSLCQPFYCDDESRGGRPGIDPEVYFKMILVGFFENIASERGVAARCGDSLAIRAFLHYELTEETPGTPERGWRPWFDLDNPNGVRLIVGLFDSSATTSRSCTDLSLIAGDISS